MLTTLAVALSLTVPYLPQTDALCGGAAAAMVFRYWGDTHAGIEQFAPLVDERAGGIADDVLVRAIEEGGWRTRRFVGSVTLLADEVRNGRPVIVLLADRGPLNHYLVVTGVEADAVVVHDPAWGPGRRIAFADFMRAWRPTDFWTLEIRPPEQAAGGSDPGDGPAEAGGYVQHDLQQSVQRSVQKPVQDVPTMCDQLLGDAVDRARAAPADAYAMLEDVRAQCPAEAGPLREMAGVRFAERRWRDAADLAERAAARDPADEYAWELLASSRYLQDDLPGALRAWNRIGKPLVNLVHIEGLAHARFQAIAAVMGLQPNALLTEDAFRLAARRLQALPDRAAARLTFRPEPDGFVTVTAAIAERRGPPRTAVAWTAAALQTALEREPRAAIPGSTGQAELWSASWRWWQGRPRVAAAFAVPRTGGIGGVWRVDAAWESQAYAPADSSGSAAAPFDESRTHGALTISDWLNADTRYSVSAGADSWRGRSYTGRTVFAGATLERRWLDDRVALSATATAWAPAGFHTTGVHAAYRSSRDAEGFVYLADAGVTRASDAAPLATWPAAGGGHAGDVLMRAHPLLDGAAIALDRESVFGRTVLYTHGEAQRWFASGQPVRAAAAVFADLARASRRGTIAGEPGPAEAAGGSAGFAGADRVVQADVGIGLRVRIPGASGMVRVDVAHGLRDGADALTFGWQF